VIFLNDLEFYRHKINDINNDFFSAGLVTS
jgi:hypothetical protein